MTKAELERRNAALEAELAVLRAHQCPQACSTATIPAGCTCGPWNAVIPAPPCPAHSAGMQTVTTVCTCGLTGPCMIHNVTAINHAAYNGWQTCYADTAGANPGPLFQIQNYQPVNAAAGVAPTVILSS